MSLSPQEAKHLLEIMEEMAELEMTLANFYQECSEVYPGDMHFWLAIKRQELQHSESIRKIAALVAAAPHEFKISRVFNAKAIRTIRNGIADTLDALRLRKIPRARLLAIARDFENSVIEAKYRDLVTTSNVEYMNMMATIDSETMTHKSLIAKKLSSVKSDKRPRAA